MSRCILTTTKKKKKKKSQSQKFIELALNVLILKKIIQWLCFIYIYIYKHINITIFREKFLKNFRHYYNFQNDK